MASIWEGPGNGFQLEEAGDDPRSALYGPKTGGEDPFAYTNNSLLTPWTEEYAPPSVGGFSGVNIDPFSYKDINYEHKGTGDYTGNTNFTARPDIAGYEAPGTFGYGEAVPGFEYNGPGLPGEFKAPNVIDDPGYKLRISEGLDALQNTALGRGIRGGDVQQALMRYGQEMGSQEYARAWERAMGASNFNMARQNQAWNQAMGKSQYGLAAQAQGYGQAANTYGLNESTRLNAAGLNFNIANANTANAMAAHEMNERNRLAAYNATSANNLGQGALGWSIASGNYDRNRANALDAWNARYQIAASQAAASNANAGRARADYDERYRMNYGIFRENQNTQFGRLMDMSQLGLSATGLGIGAGGNYANAYGNNVYNSANAYGAGKISGANAWGSALGSAANAAGMGAVFGSPIGQDMFGYGPPPPGTAEITGTTNRPV